MHGAYESDVRTHSRTSRWYKERTVATHAGSLITAEEASLSNENSSESKQDECHKTCIIEFHVFQNAPEKLGINGNLS